MRFAVFLGALLASSGFARASSLSFANTWTLLCIGSKDLGSCPVQKLHTTGSPPILTSDSGTYTYGAFGSDYYTVASYDTKARTTFGSLQAESSLSVVGRQLSPVTYADSYSYFQDALTFTGGTGAGFVRIGFHLDGSGFDQTQPTGLNGPVGVSTLFYYFGSAPFESFTSLDATNKTINTELYGPLIPITFGTPIEIQMSMVAETSVYCFGENIGGGCGIWLSSTSKTDFYDTAILNSITVTDTAGNLIDDFHISSHSGTNYSAAGITPEPGSLMLLVFGLFSIFVLALFRQRILPK